MTARWHTISPGSCELRVAGGAALATILHVATMEYRWLLAATPLRPSASQYAAQRAVRRVLRETISEGV